MEDMSQNPGHCRVDMKESMELVGNTDGLAAGALPRFRPKFPSVEFNIERTANPDPSAAAVGVRLPQDVLSCRDLVVSGSSRKPSAVVHVAVVAPREQYLVCEAYTETVESVFLGSATFSVGDLLRATDQRLTLNLRSSDGVCGGGAVVVSRLRMGEMEEADMDNITTDTLAQK
ncbi:hypothetical protein NHX12_018745, partial [Muraenolepis orangiensis]